MFAAGWSPGYIPASATEADNNDTEVEMNAYKIFLEVSERLKNKPVWDDKDKAEYLAAMNAFVESLP